MNVKNYNKFNLDIGFACQMLFIFALICAISMLPSIEVYADDAATSDGLSIILCKIANTLTSSVGKAISIIAIVVLGIGLFMGKLSWALALSTAIGIGLIFGASKIVTWLAGTAASGTTCPTS